MENSLSRLELVKRELYNRLSNKDVLFDTRDKDWVTRYLHDHFFLNSCFFLLTDDKKTINLSLDNQPSLLPKIVIPSNSKIIKKKLNHFINKASENLTDIKRLEFPKLSPKTSRDVVQSAFYGNFIGFEQTIYVLDCYMKAVDNCLSRETDGNPHENDFALEKKFFGRDFEKYIYRGCKDTFTRLIKAFKIDKCNTKQLGFIEQKGLSEQRDINYEHIKDVFHYKLPFPILLYVAIYVDLLETYKTRTFEEAPVPFVISTKFKLPIVKNTIIISAILCIQTSSLKCLKRKYSDIIGSLLSTFDYILLTIKDTYLSNKKVAELKKERERTYYALKRARIAEVFARNKSHNLGSHVMSKFGNPKYSKDYSKNIVINYTPLKTNNKETQTDFIDQASLLINYSTQRDAYCTDILNGAPITTTTITIRNLLLELDKNRLVLNHISGYGDKFKYRFKVFFDDEEPANWTDPRYDWPVAIPNDKSGCHAFFNIVENIIRNTAKYAPHDASETVDICFRFLEKPREQWIIHSEDNTKQISFESRPIIPENGFYVVEIYSNILQKNIKQIVQKQEEYILKPIVDPNTLEMRTEAKGLIEMACSATYLRGQDVVRVDESRNQPSLHYHIEDINILNSQEEPVFLKAFGLARMNLDKTIDNYSETVDIMCSTGIGHNGHSLHARKVVDPTGTSHACFFLTDKPMETGKYNEYDGFLGYRFFLLKPKDVLIVCDNDTDFPNAEKLKTIPGIDIVTSEELKERLGHGENIRHEILVCDNENLVKQYRASLPARVIPTSIFTEEGSTEEAQKDPVAYCWEKWVEKNTPIITNYNTSICRDKSTAYINDHINSSEAQESFENAANYAEALSSLAQQHLPEYEENCRDSRGKPGLATYLGNISTKSGISHYRLLESFNTKVLLVDEDLQQKSSLVPALGANTLPLETHWEKCGIILPEINLSVNDKETIGKIKKCIDKAADGNEYDFIFIHLGLLERIFEALHPDKKYEKMTTFLEGISEKTQVVIKSGRGIPEYLPKCVRFVQQTSVDNVITSDLRSKYLFTALLYSSRAVHGQSI